MCSLFSSRSNNFRDHVIAPYDGLPDVGTVFAILIESKCFRAIRTHSEVINNAQVHHQECIRQFKQLPTYFIYMLMQSTLVSYKVTLIDIGETIALPLYRSEKFQLSQSAALMSPMAILCLVEKVCMGRNQSVVIFVCTYFGLFQVDGEPENCLQRMFGNKRFNFEIKNICA